PFWNIGRGETAYTFDLAEKIVEHVTPVADHIEDDAAAILLPVVPRRPLRLLPAAFKYPIAELAADREHATEEPGIAQERELLQSGEEQFVLHRTVLDAPALRKSDHRKRLLKRRCDRLLAIRMLACIDRLGQQSGTRLRGRGVEEYAIVLVSKCLVEIGGP